MIVSGGPVWDNYIWIFSEKQWHSLQLESPLPFLVHHTAVFNEFVQTNESLVPSKGEVVRGTQFFFHRVENARSTDLSNERRYMIIFGGTTEPKVYSDALYFVDTETYNWRQLELRNSPPAMSSHTAVVLDNRMYVYGGRNEGTVFSELWCLDLTDLEWTRVEAVNPEEGPGKRAGHTCSVVDHSLVITGGWDGYRTEGGSEMGACDMTVFVFNVALRKWSSYADEKSEVAARDMHSVAMVSPLTMVLFGGTDSDFEYLEDTWTLNLSSSVSPKSLIEVCVDSFLKNVTEQLQRDSEGRWANVNVAEIDIKRRCRICQKKPTRGMKRCASCQAVFWCSDCCDENKIAHKLCCNSDAITKEALTKCIHILEKSFAPFGVLMGCNDKVLQNCLISCHDDAITKTILWFQKRIETI